jgi:dTDP-glucose 4,6-dehydratase
MRVLVTGGAGFIGSNFIHYLLEHFPLLEILNLDKLTYAGNLENLRLCEDNPNYHFLKGDIANPQDLEEAWKFMPEVVVNFAAESHVDRSITDPSPFITTNVVGTSMLLHFAKEHKVRRFIQVSTDEVYGSLGETGYFTEQSPLAPNSPYAASKTSADLLVRSYVKTYGFPGIITRCSNNYGPYQFPEKFIPLMLSNALLDQPLPLYGDGLQVRDWLYVRDHCRAIALVLFRGKPGEVYNIGGHNESTNLDLLKTLLKILNKPQSLITYVQDRPGHDRRYAIDPTKIQNELGWVPTVLIEEGLIKTVEWYKENKLWWQRIRSGAYSRYYEAFYLPKLQAGDSK